MTGLQQVRVIPSAQTRRPWINCRDCYCKKARLHVIFTRILCGLSEKRRCGKFMHAMSRFARDPLKVESNRKLPKVFRWGSHCRTDKLIISNWTLSQIYHINDCSCRSVIYADFIVSYSLENDLPLSTCRWTMSVSSNEPQREAKIPPCIRTSVMHDDAADVRRSRRNVTPQLKKVTQLLQTGPLWRCRRPMHHMFWNWLNMQQI